MNMGKVDRTGNIWSLGNTPGIARTKIGERKRERELEFSNLDKFDKDTYFFIFVLALICDCVLPLLRPGNSSISNTIHKI